MFDGNGSFVRFQAGGGPTLTKRRTTPNGGDQNESLWAHNISPPLGTRPRLLGLNKKPPVPHGRPLLQESRPRPQRARLPPTAPRPAGGPVKRAIREHLRDFIAIGVLAVLAIVTTSVILVRQQANFPSWLPILGQSHFELKAEFSSSQAVTPGQGQTVDLSGVKIGSVQGVNLESGRAVVTMNIDPKYAPLIHTDASLLLRPRTGLQDMTIEIDPGQKDRRSRRARPSRSPTRSRTSIRTRSWPAWTATPSPSSSCCSRAVPRGSTGIRNSCRPALRRFDPTVRDIARINGALVKRRQNLRRVITNFGKLSTALGHRDTQLARFVRSSNTVLGSFAKEQNAIRATLQEFPPTLQQTQSTLTSANRLRRCSGRRSRKLIPSAQALAPALRQVRPLFRETTGPIQNQIRPFARAVQKPLKHINQASPAACRGDDRPHQGLQRAQHAVQRPRLQPARAQPRRATCSGSPGSTTTPTPCSSPRTRAARCGTASC